MSRLQTGVRFLRGAILAPRVTGGRRLRVGSGFKLSRPAPDTRLVLGDWVHLHEDVALFLDRPGACIEIGAHTYLNRRTEIAAFEHVSIGAHCAIAWDVHITDTDYHSLNGRPMTAAVHIGDRVWVGARSTILKGVEIGAGAVVAAGSTVTRDVPPATLVAGTPARALRSDVLWD